MNYLSLFIINLYLTDENNKNIIWLKNNQEPWADVVEKWTSTYEYRQGLLSQDIDFQEILATFPILQNPLGHCLIDVDFKRKYANHYQLLYNNFEKVCYKLLQLRKNNLNQSDNLIVEIINSETVAVGKSIKICFFTKYKILLVIIFWLISNTYTDELNSCFLLPMPNFIVFPESRHYLFLSLLPSLLPNKAYNKKGKNNWYPTSSETVNGLIVHVKVIIF